VHLDGDDWARDVVFLERRCELGAGLGSARSGVLCCGRGVVRFSSGAYEMVRGAACPAS
jgi:hypothetical protein